MCYSFQDIATKASERGTMTCGLYASIYRCDVPCGRRAVRQNSCNDSKDINVVARAARYRKCVALLGSSQAPCNCPFDRSSIEDGALKLFKCTFPGFKL